WHFVNIRIEHIFAIDVANTCATDRAHERNTRDRQCCRGCDHCQNIGIIIQIVLNNGEHNLSVVFVAFYKKWTDRTVDQARNKSFILARAAFTLEIATRDLAGGVSLFLIIYGKREKVLTRLWFLGGDHGRQNDGFAIGCKHSSVSLTGDLASFENERTTTPIDFNFMGIEHILSSVESFIERNKCAGGFPGWRTGHGQDNGKLAKRTACNPAP